MYTLLTDQYNINNMETFYIKYCEDLIQFKTYTGYHIRGNAEFDDLMVINGELVVDGWLCVNVGGCFEVGGSIEVRGWIRSKASIKAGCNIEAGDNIESEGSIIVGNNCGIRAGYSIACKTILYCNFKIFAGICTWKELTISDKSVTCGRLEGGGTVEYGRLNETGMHKDIIELNGVKYQKI